MSWQIFLSTFALVVAFMSLMWLVARSKKRLDVVDMAWGLSAVLIAWSVQLQAPSDRGLILAVIVSIWGTRLALHIFERLRFRQEDPRYKELSAKWQGNYWLRAYLSIFLLQGVLVSIICLPIFLAANEPLRGWEWLVAIGAAVWLVGFVIEAIADRQLQTFLKDKNHPIVMSRGLWRYSRHPNYFGEITQWKGIALIGLSASWGWLGLIGPALLTYLIVFVSGLPPIEKKRQNDAEYQAYQRRTSALIPLPPREAG